MAILSRLGGSRFMSVGDAVVNYPSNGAGGITATASSSELVNEAREVVIDGILLTAVHTSATTIAIFLQDGTTALIPVINIPAAAAGVSVQTWISLGAPGVGLRVPPVGGKYGFAAQASNAGTKFVLCYRTLRP